MLERHWKGIAQKDRADEYITHLQNETFKQIKRIEGFIIVRDIMIKYDETVSHYEIYYRSTAG